MSLENPVKHLSISSQGYIVIRRLFLTTYKRDREGRYDLREGAKLYAMGMPGRTMGALLLLLDTHLRAHCSGSDT